VDLGLANKVALVCGASQGIGYAAAEEFAREGATLAICSREQAAIEAAAKRLAPYGAKVLPIVADLSTTAGIETVVARTTEQYGRVDVLVTNTGGPPDFSGNIPAISAYTKAMAIPIRIETIQMATETGPVRTAM